MLTNLTISNFKSLKQISLNLNSLNILSGLNGMGKSSVIQSLLLLRQSFQNGLLENGGLVLKGNYIELGIGKDVFYQGAGEDEKLVFEYVADTAVNKWSFDYSAQKHVLPINEESTYQIDAFTSSSIFNNNFQYINAEHIPPTSLHKKSQFDVNENRQIGIRGEYAVHYLVEFGDKEKVSFDNLIHPKAKSPYLLHNVDAWLSEISPGVKLNTEDLLSVDQAKLGFQFEHGNEFTNEFRPINVGFGISHVLPILVSLLSANENKLILLENPECHIHPRGQAIIGQLLLRVAMNKVQILVETHSDHILNGIRAEVFEQKKGSEFVNLFFFERNKDDLGHYSIVVTPKLDNNGRIDQWPDGFFDEWEKVLFKIV